MKVLAYLAFPDESGIAYKGYFEAKQLTSGAIVIGFVPIAQESDGSKTGPVYSEPSFHGRDPDGWDISTYGQTGVSPILGRWGAPKSAIYPAHVFRPEGIRARRDGATESGYSKVQFLVSNLLWHDRNVVPEPITLEIGELTLTVAPIGDYLEVAGSIMAVRGIAPTAQVLIKASDASNRSLQYFGDLMDDLVSVFRLATGNGVDWYYGEAFEVGTETVVERFHKDAVTGPFSRVVRYRQPRSGWVIRVMKNVWEVWTRRCGWEGVWLRLAQYEREAAMRGTSDQQIESLVALTPEDLVPQEHPIRRIKPLADRVLQELSPTFSRMYAKGGRPSVPPEHLLKASLLIALYSVRSERQFCEGLIYDMLFRWFLDLNIRGGSFDQSTFAKNRTRLLTHEVTGRFFGAVVSEARRQRLLSEEHFSVDGTLLEAWASLKSVRPRDEEWDPPAGVCGRNPWKDFRGERRSNATHVSTTDPEALLARRGGGAGGEAVLRWPRAH